MTLATDYLTHFAEGWAQYLAAAGLGLTWDPAGVYDPANKNIWLLSGPTDPRFDGSVVVILTPFVLANDPAFADSTVALQVKTRVPSQDPRAAWAVDGPIAEKILGNWPLTLPNSVLIEDILAGSTSVSLGLDDKQHLTWASTYPFRVYRPGSHRA